MNDFTKEELQDIYEVFDRQGACRLLDLKSKIQSMIDNYCDQDCKHESDGYDYFKIGEDELLMDVLKTRKHQLKCSKCHRVYDDNQ